MRETAYDYDQSIFFVQRDEDSEIIKFAFSCNGSKDILQNGGEEMLSTLYKGKLSELNVLYKWTEFDAKVISDDSYVIIVFFN